MKTLLITVLGLLVSPLLFAQEVEMADTMRSEGKIYVVVSILVLILAGLLLYVFLTDRKISGLEKKIAEKKR
ncbi:MAG TPA: CcmD family protein [Cyclobacteriaceae bacterium]